MIKSNIWLWLVLFLAIVAPSFLFGAVKVVIYIILGLILLFVILSAIFSVKIQNMRVRMEDQMRNGGTQGQRANASSQKGDDDVKIFTTKDVNEKRVSKDVGDYVEFEEIKDKD